MMGVRLDKSGRRQRLRKIDQPERVPPPVPLLRRVAQFGEYAFKANVSRLEEKLDSNLVFSHKVPADWSGYRYLTYRVLHPTPVHNPERETIRTLYHGTGIDALLSILHHGRLWLSLGGLLGPGIYLGSWNKAVAYKKIAYEPGGSRPMLFGAILECHVALGPMVVVEGDSPYRHERAIIIDGIIHLDDTRTRYAPRGKVNGWGGPLHHDEWAIRDNRRVSIRRIHFCQKVEGTK